MEPLRIYLLGGFFVERADVALPPIASRVGRSLFAYLVMNRDRPIQRNLLAGTFWPDLPEARARRRLSHTLWQIQDVVSENGSSHLSVTSDTMSFDTSSPYWLDVEEFDRSYELSETRSAGDENPGSRFDASSLRSCVELYRGDFMAGYFDDWVIVDQDHYRQRYLVTLNRLIDVAKSAGDYEEALSYARRLTHQDPMSEEVHREVMRLSFLLGRTGEAIQQFDRCRSVLSEELDAEPSRATIDLYDKIVRQRRAGIRPLPADDASMNLVSRIETPFVGREEERRDLVDYMERVLAGPGGIVLLEGEPGVGKTRLAYEAAEDARWRGFEVSWGTCIPGALRPYGPLVEVLDSLNPLRVEQLTEQVSPVWLGEALRLAPGLGKGGRVAADSVPLRPVEESTRMREALMHTLGALGEITPHLIVVDDVQWADRDTLGVISQLGRRLAESRILLMLLYRSEEARGDPEVWDMLRDGDRVAGLGRVVLSPLSVFELEEMVKRTLGLTRLEPAVATQLHRQTGGNALFSLETLLEMRDRGLFDSGEPSEVLQRHLASVDMPVAPRVRSVIDSRMALLSGDVSAVYELAAVYGSPVGLSELADAAAIARPIVLEAVDELLHRGLIRDEGNGTYRIIHDQVRQVVYDRIGHQRRISLHRRAAETLTHSKPDDVDAIGYHFWQSELADRAAPYLKEAGLRSIGLNAYATARHHLSIARIAARQASWSADARYRLLAHLEEVMDVLGEREQQSDVLDEMAELTGESLEFAGDLARRRAWLLAHTTDFTGAQQWAERSIDAERQRSDGSALSASMVALGTGLRWSGQPLKAIPHLEEAVKEAAADQEKAHALTELGSTLVEVQRPSDAFPHLDEAQRIYEESDDLRGQAEIAGIRARALHQIGDSRQATTQFGQAVGVCEAIGYRHGEGVNLVNLAVLNCLTGHVGDSLIEYDRAAQIFSELDNTRGEAMVLVNSAAARHSLIGDEERAAADAAKARKVFSQIGDDAREAQCLEILAGIAARKGRIEEARGLLDESLNSLPGTGNSFLEAQHLRSLALLELENGEPSAALATVERAERLCEIEGFEDLMPELASIRAGSYLAQGRTGDALELSSRAVEGLGAGVERPHLVHHRHALIAEACGRRIDAETSALEAMESLNATLGGLSSDDRRRALERVPEHRAIVETAARFTPSKIEVRLPAIGVPLGRELEEDDLTEISWTIDHPDDHFICSEVDRRRARVLRLLTEAHDTGADPSIEHIADVLGVSGSTIRRDLETLREAGHEVSTRGQRHAS